MLSTTSIARVTLSVNEAAAPPSSYDTGLILAPADREVIPAERVRVYTNSASAMAGILADGFPAQSLACQAAVKYFAASPAPGRLLVARYGPGETPAQGLDAALAGGAAFYGIMLADTDPQKLLDLEEHIRGLDRPMVLFIPLTGEAGQVLAEGGLLETLYARRSRRALSVWLSRPQDIGAVMGTAMGQQLSHAASAFTLCYRTVYGVEAPDLTEAQADAVKARNGNVYVTRDFVYTLLEYGTVASGARYHEVLYQDMIAAELRAAAVALLTGSAELLPQTDDTTALFLSEFGTILRRYTERRILATGLWREASFGPLITGQPVEDGYLLWADSYDTQTAADRAARRAMPVHAALLMSGGVESVLIHVNVQL